MHIQRVECFEGPAVHYYGNDGYPTAMIIPVIIAYDHNNNMYQLPNEVKTICYDGESFKRLRFTLSKGRELCAKIMAKGEINLDCWVKVNNEQMKEYLSSAFGYAGE